MGRGGRRGGKARRFLGSNNQFRQTLFTRDFLDRRHFIQRFGTSVPFFDDVFESHKVTNATSISYRWFREISGVPSGQVDLTTPVISPSFYCSDFFGCKTRITNRLDAVVKLTVKPTAR
eukprot:Lithocolla_globosa_v1_NODE_1446_length_2570_cov_8.811531.p3 type:complete len:119 gc:universal NODE_1446_length_2570_cov_8.811531:1378-1734(+)